VGLDYLAKNILTQSGTVVFESSHGILTDRYYGFHPHTTKSRTIPQVSLDLLTECGYDGQIFKLGVTRAYQIRHGAGPMITESPYLLDKLLPGSSKEQNRWQGRVRVGPLDLVSLRYAIEVCGGPQFFDGLAITWFDQIQKIGEWEMCDQYYGTDNLKYFSPTHEIKVRRGAWENQLDYQEQLGKQLNMCRPGILSNYLLEYENIQSSIDLCSSVLREKTGVPVRMISFGPTEKDKICL